MAGSERELIHYIDRLEEESRLRMDETPLREAEQNVRFMRGQQWPDSSLGPPSPFRPESAQYRFTLNMMGQLIKRKTALITDTRPTIDVQATATGKKHTAAAFETLAKGVWDANQFDMEAPRELVRASTIGSTACVVTWNPQADYGRGQIELLTYDPRHVRLDPSITRVTHVQRFAEYVMVKEVKSLNFIREAYPRKGPLVQASAAWSRYRTGQGHPATSGGGVTSPQLPVLRRPWRKRDEDDTRDSASPRAEIRHTWLRDWERDERGLPLFGRPRITRYIVDSEGVVLKDERLRFRHGHMPVHLLDWDVELEHPWGMPEISGLRRIQYTLNRIVGQVMDNILMTNRMRVIGDHDALDPKTKALLAQNPNGIYLWKKAGRALEFATPQGAIPQFIIPIIQLLMGAIDTVSGMNEVTRGIAGKGAPQSGAAIDALQLMAQSVIRMEARAFENWLERIFQQVLPLIWQYYLTDRVVHLLGPGPGLVEFLFNRAQFIRDDAGQTMNVDTAWQDFVFRVMPGSSLAMTRIQKGVMAANLYQMGLVTGEDVLVAAEWPSPTETVAKAREEMAQGLGPGARTSRKMQRLPAQNRRQSVQMAAAG